VQDEIKARRIFLTLAVAASLAAPAAAPATLVVGRNPKNPTLQVDSSGRAMITFASGGKTQHVLAWGAVNALPPTRGKRQTAFDVDYSGGWAIHKPRYWRTFRDVCRRYTGPALAWYVAGSGCNAPDGSHWALQLWQRLLPNLGFKPWNREQAVYELHVSHWTGPLARLEVYQGWAWGGRFQQILGRLEYRGKAVHGFGSTSLGNPTDAYGRNLYLDTFDSPYGPGWARENSFLAQQPAGAFCYSLGLRPPYAGYPDTPARMGPGSMYRITVLGPGVSPAVMWQGPSLGDWDPKDSAKVATKTKVEAIKKTLDLSQAECHS
jgi:hypothetical protein